MFSRFVAKMTTLNTYYLRKMNRMLKPGDKELVRATIEYFKQKDLKVYDTVSELNHNSWALLKNVLQDKRQVNI